MTWAPVLEPLSPELDLGHGRLALLAERCLILTQRFGTERPVVVLLGGTGVGMLKKMHSYPDMFRIFFAQTGHGAVAEQVRAE